MKNFMAKLLINNENVKLLEEIITKKETDLLAKTIENIMVKGI